MAAEAAFKFNRSRSMTAHEIQILISTQVAKILNCFRVVVLLMATTTVFTIYTHISQKDIPKQVQYKPVNLEGVHAKLNEINIKIDRMFKEDRLRDALLLVHLIKIQRQLEQKAQGRMAIALDN